MRARLKSLVEIVHDSGESVGYFPEKTDCYVPGVRREYNPDGTGKEIRILKNGYVRETSLARHYADISATIKSFSDERDDQDIKVRVHMKRLYNEFSGTRKNATRKARDRFDADISHILAKYDEILVEEKDGIFEPDYFSLQAKLGLPLSI